MLEGWAPNAGALAPASKTGVLDGGAPNVGVFASAAAELLAPNRKPEEGVAAPKVNGCCCCCCCCCMVVGGGVGVKLMRGEGASCSEPVVAGAAGVAAAGCAPPKLKPKLDA